MIRKKVVFVSCGQETASERALGHQICSTIDMFPRTKSFYADLVHSPNDLNSEVFGALNRCDAFFAVMHDRGTVQYNNKPAVRRSSVWIQQEIAILCFRMSVRKTHLPVRVYMEEPLFLEGVMKTAIVNPIGFKEPYEVLDGLSTWLSGHDFDEDPIAARRETSFRQRVATIGEMEWLAIELAAAHTSAGRLDPV
jgi:hypothetical protein